MFQYNSFGQNPILDSLKITLKNARHDTTRCAVYNALGEQIYLDRPDSSIILWHTARILAEKNIANNVALRKDYSKYLAVSLNNIGFGYTSRGDIPKALEYLHQAVKVQEEINDRYGLAYSLYNLGNIYDGQNDFIKSLEYHTKSLKIREKIGDKQSVATSLNIIGLIYVHKDDDQKALKYYQKSLDIREEIGDKEGIATSLNNIGIIYVHQKDFEKALDHYFRALMIDEERGDRSAMATSLNNIANAMHQKGDVKGAIPYAKRAMQIAKELGFPDEIQYSANTLKTLFQLQNNYKGAFEMFELEIEMRDSVNNVETQKTAVQKQMQYAFEKKELEAKAEQDKKDVIANEEKQKQRIIIYATSIGFIIVLVSGLFILRGFRQKQKDNKIITLQKIEVENQKHLIEEKHKEITDSINYAERIQRSFLATENELKDNLKDYFVFFQPKDVVSGDFYWGSKLNNGNFALATADSTGHGVPGAIMSILNISCLENAVKEGETEPFEILNHTRVNIIERLKKDGSAEGGKDGMDCSLVVFDTENKKLKVAAANNPVWIVRGSDVIDIKPDKMPVGKHDKQTISFTQQEVELITGDVVYTLTDGFPDQFGGDKGKKFMIKNLRELIIANAHLPMNEQKNLLRKTLNNWAGNLEQVDDITVIGIRI